jgi:hypothetical protein
MGSSFSHAERNEVQHRSSSIFAFQSRRIAPADSGVNKNLNVTDLQFNPESLLSIDFIACKDCAE